MLNVALSVNLSHQLAAVRCCGWELKWIGLVPPTPVHLRANSWFVPVCRRLQTQHKPSKILMLLCLLQLKGIHTWTCFTDAYSKMASRPPDGSRKGATVTAVR